MLKTTPFHSRTAPLVRAQTWRRWAGYQAASAYEPVNDREYAAIRNAAALIDISPLYKYLVSGRDALRLLDRMVTRDVSKCAVGQVLYTPWCDGAGKVVDDGTVSRLDETTFRLTSAEPNLRWLTLNAAGMDVAISDISDAVGALSLQGPLARAILEQVCPADVAALKYFRQLQTAIRNIPVTISRTGYTGDLGYEIWVDAGEAIGVWDALMQAGRDYGITPCGVWAMDTARIEAGLIMLDVDYYSAHHALTEQRKSSPRSISAGPSTSAKARIPGARRCARKANAGRPGASSASRSAVTCWSNFFIRRTCRSSSRPCRGAAARRSTATADRSVTPPPAAGRRSLRNIWRWLICVRRTTRPEHG
jgi:aminomethyltransferase